MLQTKAVLLRCVLLLTSLLPAEVLAGLIVIFPSGARAAQFLPPENEIAPASNEGQLAIKKFTIAPGLKVDLWAAEPLLANPVAICSDEKGRWHVAETY